MIGGSTVPGAPNSRSVAAHRIKKRFGCGCFSILKVESYPVPTVLSKYYSIAGSGFVPCPSLTD